jgi:hypothetical protein
MRHRIISSPPLPTLDNAPACGRVAGGLTDEEVAILARLRTLHDEARALRASLLAAGADDAEVERGLAALRERRRALAAERDAARHRRMVLLGHETAADAPPPPGGEDG